MKKIFHILSLLLISIVTGYAQWVWQNPLPQGNSLNSVQYINDNLVWSGGIGGTLIKSIDGGNNWEVILLPEKLTVYDLFFINEQKGWATTGADNGTYKIFLTTNGGSSWAVQTDTIVSCRPIVFADEFRGWTGDWGNIWATTDGGENWFLQYDGSTNKFNSIFLIDDQHLIVSMEALRGGPLIKTANGGKDWIIDSTITWVQDVHFLDTLVGWAVGYSNIGKTTDGGATWQIQYNILDENWIDIYMHDSNRGWAVSTDGKIVSTTNGGISWTQQKNPAYSSLGSITFKNSSEGIITGFLGTILKTTNGGDEWIDMAKAVTKESLEGIYFLNENVGWIAGWNGLIIKTTDGGNNWELLFSGVNSSLGDIYFTNEMLGWATGTNGTIIHSTDGGQNWKPQKSPVNIYLSDIEFRYYPVGWIIGSEVFSDGRLLKTTDGGNTWKEANTIFPQGANTIQFTSEVRGWIM
ncbi:MAG: YCF48-related protein, partial [Ignavibacteriaceae bacterium]